MATTSDFAWTGEPRLPPHSLTSHPQVLTEKVTDESTKPSVPGFSKPKQLSKDDWEELKPLLQKLYIEDKHTLTRVREILKTNHGISLTDKQLTTRFREWNLAKYNKLGAGRTAGLNSQASTPHPTSKTSQKKRPLLLQGVEGQRGAPLGMDRLASSAMQPINHITGQVDLGSLGTVFNEDDIITPSGQAARFSPAGLEIHHGPHSPEEFAVLFESPARISKDFDVVLVARLFAVLNMEIPTHIPDHYSNMATTGSETLESGYFLNRDLQNLKSKYPEETSSFHLVQHHGFHQSRPDCGTDKRMPRIFKVGAADIVLPPIHSYPPSPFNEVYFFPPESDHHRNSSGSKLSQIVSSGDVTIMASYRMQEVELTEKLGKLQRICSDDNPAILELIIELANVYSTLRKFHLGEVLCKREIAAIRKASGRNALQQVDLYFLLVDICIFQNKIEEAKTLFEEAKQRYGHALEELVHTHPLFLKFLQRGARLSRKIGDYAAAEDLHRQAIQINLCSLGPRHRDTLDTMRLLAANLAELETRRSASEKLLQIIVDLGGEVTEFSIRTECLSLQYLARALRKNRKFHSSESAIRRSIKLAVQVLGEEHPTTLECNLELGKLLFEANQIPEAVELLERGVRDTCKAWGPVYELSLWGLSLLGRCYRRQEKYTEALVAYEWMIAEITGKEGPDHPSLEKLRRRVRQFQSKLEEQ